MQMKYAIVELIDEKGTERDIVCGLLRGVGEEEGQRFIWAVTGKKIVRAFNLQYYNILSVVTYDGMTKTYTFFMAEEDEQEEALKIVENAYKELSKIALPQGATLLDVSKFENVPDDFEKINSLPKQQSVTSKPTINAANNTYNKNWYDHGHGSTYTPPVKKDPEPFSWKRKSRKPTKKALELMREKIDEIAKKGYEYKPRPIKGEKKAQKAASKMSAADQAPFDDDIPFCGC